VQVNINKTGVQNVNQSLTITQSTTWTASANGSGPSGTTASSGTTTITFNFDLSVSGLVAGDITITGVTKGALTSSNGNKTWTLAVTPTVGGSNTISVNISKTGVVSGAKSLTIWGCFPLWVAAGSSPFPTGVIIRGIAYGGPTTSSKKFVCVGTNGGIAYSSDGITWTALGNSTFGSSSRIMAVAWGWVAISGSGSWVGRFVAGAFDGKMAYSSTNSATTWTVVGNSPSSGVMAIAWGANKFVAGGSNLAWSSDGINWTAIPHSTSHPAAVYGIVWGNNRFVAVGMDGKIAYSLTE